MDATLTSAMDADGTARANAVDEHGSVWGGLLAGTSATVGASMGLAPYVIQHLGLVAGAALLTGALGISTLYAAGLLLSVPLLVRLRWRFNTSRAPILGVAAFTVLFSISSFVLGPLVTPPGAEYLPVPTGPAATPDIPPAGHHE